MLDPLDTISTDAVTSVATVVLVVVTAAYVVLTHRMAASGEATARAARAQAEAAQAQVTSMLAEARRLQLPVLVLRSAVDAAGSAVSVETGLATAAVRIELTNVGLGTAVISSVVLGLDGAPRGSARPPLVPAMASTVVSIRIDPSQRAAWKSLVSAVDPAAVLPVSIVYTAVTFPEPREYSAELVRDGSSWRIRDIAATGEGPIRRR